MIYTNSTTNYTNIDTQKSVYFAVPRTETRLKNASDLYMKYRSYAEHCRPCTRLSGVNRLKKDTCDEAHKNTEKFAIFIHCHINIVKLNTFIKLFSATNILK